MLSSLVLLISCTLSLTNALPPRKSQAAIRIGDPYEGKPRLTFQADGTFKLTVFSDLHFGEAPDLPWGPAQDANSTRLMRAVLADEKPDFVVINGDLITGEDTFKENSTSLIDQIVAPLNEVNVPFATTQGNHDNQVNITHLQEIEREHAVAPLSYTKVAPLGVGGEQGPGTYWLPVYQHAEDDAPVLILWFFDSRGGVSPGGPYPNDLPHDLPDYVDPSVGDWIATETAAMDAAWGPPFSPSGRPTRDALAFVHIPPHAIQALQHDVDPVKTPGLNEDVLGLGSVQDSLQNPPQGSLAQTPPRDQPFWDSLTANVKNLRAIVSGHDHGNEWCARDTDKDTIFCFGKHSGYGGYGRHWWGFGVRSFLFTAPGVPLAPVRDNGGPDAVGRSGGDGSTRVDTWIRYENGTTRAHIVLDGLYDR